MMIIHMVDIGLEWKECRYFVIGILTSELSMSVFSVVDLRLAVVREERSTG
jgi:hypothetical protein